MPNNLFCGQNLHFGCIYKAYLPRKRTINLTIMALKMSLSFGTH